MRANVDEKKVYERKRQMGGMHSGIMKWSASRLEREDVRELPHGSLRTAFGDGLIPREASQNCTGAARDEQR